MNDAAAQLRATMTPLVPLATGWAPKLPHLEGIKAVVFDLYGTLLISGAGGGSHESGAASGDPAELEDALRESVRVRQELKRKEGVEYPEIEIREVWADLLDRMDRPALSGAEIEALALRHECRVNPVWPMPNATEMITMLREDGFQLGILSNAQFYTRPVMEALFGRSLDELGFDPGLCVFSFEEREGKPSSRLFSLMRERLAERGFGAESCFYLGNDLHKDVIPARAVGFRTGLFAGDVRSLRLGSVSVEESISLSDAVITDLAQVPGLF